MRKVIKSGRAFNGSERDRGRIVHLVDDNKFPSWHKSLCGTVPGRRGNGWCFMDDTDEVTCKKCLSKTSLPEYVTLNGTALRLQDDVYYRDAGEWFTGYEIIGGKLFSAIPAHKKIHNVELIPCTKEFYIKDNGEYSKVK